MATLLKESLMSLRHEQNHVLPTYTNTIKTGIRTGIEA